MGSQKIKNIFRKKDSNLQRIIIFDFLSKIIV